MEGACHILNVGAPGALHARSRPWVRREIIDRELHQVWLRPALSNGPLSCHRCCEGARYSQRGARGYWHERLVGEDKAHARFASDCRKVEPLRGRRFPPERQRSVARCCARVRRHRLDHSERPAQCLLWPRFASHSAAARVAGEAGRRRGRGWSYRGRRALEYDCARAGAARGGVDRAVSRVSLPLTPRPVGRGVLQEAERRVGAARHGHSRSWNADAMLLAPGAKVSEQGAGALRPPPWVRGLACRVG